MEKVGAQRIDRFLSEVYEDICEGEVSPMQLTELYRVIRLLMGKAQDQRLEVLLASLEYRAWQYKQQIEERLGVRN